MAEQKTVSQMDHKVDYNQMIGSLKPNSKSSIEKENEGSHKLQKVVKGDVSPRKRKLRKQVADNFLSEDATNVKSYLIFDVLIPAAKNTLSNLVSSGIDMLLFGEARSSRSRKGDSYVSYDRISYNRGRHDRDYRDSRTPIRSRAARSFESDLFESRGDAEEVLQALLELIDNYGMASIADYYELVGVTGEFTDNKYGWDNLSTTKVMRDRSGGFFIDFPRPILID